MPGQPEALAVLVFSPLTPPPTPSRCSGVGVMPSWREQREGAGRPAGAGAPPETLRLRDGSRGPRQQEPWSAEMIRRWGRTGSADLTCLASTHVGSPVAAAVGATLQGVRQAGAGAARPGAPMSRT